MIRGLTSSAAQKFTRTAVDQARYHLVHPFLITRVQKAHAPAQIFAEINNQFSANLSLVQANNILLLQTLQKEKWLHPSSVLSDTHYKAGLQVVASNIALLRQANIKDFQEF